MKSDFWVNWLGLPHIYGEDPRNGKGACCLQVARAVNETLRLCFPTPCLEEIGTLVKAGKWQELTELYEGLTMHVEPDYVRPGDMTLHQFGGDPEYPVGIGTVVSENYMLMPSRRRGLLAVPRFVWGEFEIRRYA